MLSLYVSCLSLQVLPARVPAVVATPSLPQQLRASSSCEMMAKSKKPSRKKTKARPRKTTIADTAAPLGAPMVLPDESMDARPTSLSAPDPSLPRKDRIDAVLRNAGLSQSDARGQQMQQAPDSPLSRIPEEGQVLLERFFGSGALLFGGIFVASGIGISVEALCKVTGNPLPVWLDEALVQYVEPALTPSILILFFFSISLGLLKQLQMTAGSMGVLYQEEDD